MTNKKITVQALGKFSPASQQWTDDFWILSPNEIL